MFQRTLDTAEPTAQVQPANALELLLLEFQVSALSHNRSQNSSRLIVLLRSFHVILHLDLLRADPIEANAERPLCSCD